MAVCHRPASIGSWSVPVSGPVFSSCPPHYRRRAAPSGSLEMPWEAGIDDNALAPAASPPPAFQLSTVNAVARRTQPYAPNKVRRTIDVPPQSFPLQLGLRSHLAVARPLPVHWLCPLRTPATTPAKVHAGLRCDFLKKTPCASLSESANVFFFCSCHQRPKGRQTALSPKFSLSEAPVPLDRAPSTHGAAPDLPVGPYWPLPSTESPARTSYVPHC